MMCHIRIYCVGAGFESKLDYASGFFQIRIKIPNKDARGVVTAFYVRMKLIDISFLILTYLFAMDQNLS